MSRRLTEEVSSSLVVVAPSIGSSLRSPDDLILVHYILVDVPEGIVGVLIMIINDQLLAFKVHHRPSQPLLLVLIPYVPNVHAYVRRVNSRVKVAGIRARILRAYI
jgi:hypothetical protein